MCLHGSVLREPGRKAHAFMKSPDLLGAAARRLISPVLLLLTVLWFGSPGCDHPEVGGGGSGGAQDPPAMPATLKMAVLRAQQKAPGHDFLPDAAGILRARAGHAGDAAKVEATARGVRLARTDDGGFELGIETTSVGRRGEPRSKGVRGLRAEGQELVLDREDGVEERFLAGPLGLEHSFVISARPEGRGPLAIEVAFDGLVPEGVADRTDQVVLRDDDDMVRAGYRDLVAADATGRELSARMEVRGAGVTLVIEDAGARTRSGSIRWCGPSKPRSLRPRASRTTISAAPWRSAPARRSSAPRATAPERARRTSSC